VDRVYSESSLFLSGFGSTLHGSSILSEEREKIFTMYECGSFFGSKRSLGYIFEKW